jgi:hypothetical protein
MAGSATGDIEAPLPRPSRFRGPIAAWLLAKPASASLRGNLDR